MTRITPSPVLGLIFSIIISFARCSRAEQTCESMYVPEPMVFSRPGDLILAHLAQLTESSADSACDLPRWTGTYSRPAMMYGDLLAYAISKINEDDEILPNVTLGFMVVDGCNSWKVNLARVWALLLDNCHGGRVLDRGRGSVEQGQEGVDQGQKGVDQGQEGVDQGQEGVDQGQGSEGGGQGSGDGKLVGLIGPISSSASVMISGALSIHRIPHMSIQATSDELSDKSR
jgi:hypothetical protein